MSTPINTTKNTGRHPVNVTHLVMGLVFLGIAGSWALRQLDVISAEGGRWVLPVILILAGAAGLVAAVAKGLSRSRKTAEEPYAESDEDPFHTD
jgi:cytochrome c oxidase subunit IV